MTQQDEREGQEAANFTVFVESTASKHGLLYFFIPWSFRHAKNYFDPFLFIRGLSCPSCIQASLSLNYLKLTIPGFPRNWLPVSCVDIGFLYKKNPRSSIGLLTHRYCQQRAITPDPESLSTNKKGAKLPLLSALPSDNISGRFFQGWRNPLMI